MSGRASRGLALLRRPRTRPSPEARATEGSARTALILGATGLVGRYCLERLISEPAYRGVIALGRRPLSRKHPKLVEVVTDFERLDEHAERFAVDDVFCCLGTTLRRAGSRDAFRRVDFGYSLDAARLAASAGAGGFLLVSAVGADPSSRVFYNRVKGELEEAIRALGLERVVILRPSLLLGSRTEGRLAEGAAQLVFRPLAPLMRGPLRRFRPVAAPVVAAALVRVALAGGSGVRILESEEIARLGGG